MLKATKLYTKVVFIVSATPFKEDSELDRCSKDSLEDLYLKGGSVMRRVLDCQRYLRYCRKRILYLGDDFCSMTMGSSLRLEMAEWKRN